MARTRAARADIVKKRRMMSITEVIAYLGISRTHFWRLRNRRKFPDPTESFFGSDRKYWERHLVREWQQKRQDEEDGV